MIGTMFDVLEAAISTLVNENTFYAETRSAYSIQSVYNQWS